MPSAFVISAVTVGLGLIETNRPGFDGSGQLQLQDCVVGTFDTGKRRSLLTTWLHDTLLAPAVGSTCDLPNR